MTRHSLALLAGGCTFLALFACGPSAEEAPPSPAPPPEEAPAEEGAPAEVVDLLPTVAEVLAVSSTTPSLRSGPRFLVDGSLETPWASRTGDDAAFVEVHLPDGSEVHGLALTAGFTKQDQAMDLFTMNLRVAAVRLLADGEEVGRWELDTESRELQRFDLNAPVAGREWKLEILETLPGSRRDWQEVCISELRLFGTAPETDGAGPRFRIGGAGGLAVEEVARARIELAAISEQGRAVGLEDWWRRVQLGLRGYPMRCAFPRVRRGLGDAVEEAFEAEGKLDAARAAKDEVACPGPGLSEAAFEEIEAIRAEADEAMTDARWDQEEARDRALLLFDEWFFQCERKLRGEEQETFRDWGLTLASAPSSWE